MKTLRRGNERNILSPMKENQRNMGMTVLIRIHCEISYRKKVRRNIY